MRKSIFALALLAALSISALADGQIGASKSCPSGQTCVNGQIGASRSVSDDQKGNIFDGLLKTVDIFGIRSFFNL